MQQSPPTQEAVTKEQSPLPTRKVNSWLLLVLPPLVLPLTGTYRRPVSAGAHAEHCGLQSRTHRAPSHSCAGIHPACRLPPPPHTLFYPYGRANTQRCNWTYCSWFCLLPSYWLQGFTAHLSASDTGPVGLVGCTGSPLKPRVCFYCSLSELLKAILTV